MRLISVEKLLARLQKQRLEFDSNALGTADAQNAAFEYGLKVGQHRGMLAAEQQLEQLLKEEDDGKRSERPDPGPTRAYG